MKLNVLDQSPIQEGQPAFHAIQNSIDLAVRCDQWGYHRYWVAEHHGARVYAGSSPEILIPEIASKTKNIRVGSGGVMLTHYSPFKVAENFGILEALYSGRIDLGVGRATGGLSLTTQALNEPHPPLDRREMYADHVRDLLGYITNQLPNDHPYKEAQFVVPEKPPEIWILGSGDFSAKLAGELGTNFALALFIGNYDKKGDPIKLYRKNFIPTPWNPKPHAMIALGCYCADSNEEAELISRPYRKWAAAFRNKRVGPFYSPQESTENLKEDEKEYFDVLKKTLVLGTSSACRQKLEETMEKYQVEEVALVSNTYDIASRVKSFQLIKKEFI